MANIAILPAMTPIQRVIEKIGSVEAVAEMCGVTVQRAKRWSYPRSRGGTDGNIPVKCMRKLLANAKKLGIDLSPADFFDGEA